MLCKNPRTYATWRLLEVYMQVLRVAGLHGCYSLLTVVLIPPWLFHIYLWLFHASAKRIIFSSLDKSITSAIQSTPLTPQPMTAQPPFDVWSFPTSSNTQRGLRCWPVQWASLPTHDSMTYAIDKWINKFWTNQQVRSKSWTFDTFDISWHFGLGLISNVSNWGPLDTWHKSFLTHKIPSTSKLHSATCKVSSDKEIPATASHWTFKQVGSLSELVVSFSFSTWAPTRLLLCTGPCLWFHFLDRLTPPVHELPAKQQFAPEGLRSWPSPTTSMTLMVMSKNDCKHGSTLSSQGTKFFACLRLICSFYTCLSSRPPSLCLQNLPPTNSLWSPSYRLVNDERFQFMARYISKFLSIAVESRDQRCRF